MPNPVDATGAPLNHSSIWPGSASPSEAVPFMDETWEETSADKAHNYAEESSNEEDDDELIFCQSMDSGAPPPAFLHQYSSIDNKPPSPFKIINSKKNATKAKPGPSDSDIMASFYDYYYWLGTRGCCKNVLGSTKLTCNCLSLFENNFDVVEAVATYVFAWTKKSYTERQVPFLSWRLLLNAIKAGGVKLGSRQEYIFPVDTTNLESFDMDIVNTNKICTSALLSLFGQGQTFWQKITKISDTGVCAKAHGNTGKKRSFQPEDQSTKALHDHFKALVSMGEVRATRFVREAVGDTSTRDDNDAIYLPSSNGTRPSYYRYCANLGYKARPTATGNIQLTWQGTNDDQEKPPVVPFTPTIGFGIFITQT